MRIMLTSAAILILGLAILGMQQFFGVTEPDEVPGVFPEWLVPLGYFLALIGALGLIFGWIRYRKIP